MSPVRASRACMSTADGLSDGGQLLVALRECPDRVWRRPRRAGARTPRATARRRADPCLLPPAERCMSSYGLRSRGCGGWGALRVWIARASCSAASERGAAAGRDQHQLELASSVSMSRASVGSARCATRPGALDPVASTTANAAMYQYGFGRNQARTQRPSRQAATVSSVTSVSRPWADATRVLRILSVWGYR